MKTKGILIDPATQSFTEVEIASYRDIAPLLDCDLFTVVDLSRTESLFVDDEGLMKPQEHFLVIDGYPQPLAGKGLILGLNPADGESVDTKMSIDDAKALISCVSGIRKPETTIRIYSM